MLLPPERVWMCMGKIMKSVLFSVELQPTETYMPRDLLMDCFMDSCFS